MKKKTLQEPSNPDLPVSKQTAGGVTGAIIGSVVAGPIGAVAGAIAGTMMGNRAAKGQTLVAPSAVKAVKDAVSTAKRKLPVKMGGTAERTTTQKSAPMSVEKKNSKVVPKKATPMTKARATGKMKRK